MPYQTINGFMQILIDDVIKINLESMKVEVRY